MGIIKAAAGRPPDSDTGVQNRFRSQSDFGFQGTFHAEAMQIGIDYFSCTLRPDQGPADPYVDVENEQLLNGGAFAAPPVAGSDQTDWQRNFQASQYQLLMFDRSEKLREDAIAAASGALGCSPADWVVLDFGAMGYQDGLLGPNGATLQYNPKGRHDMNLTFKGEACAAAGTKPMIGLMAWCGSRAGTAKRIDVNIDDYRKVVSPDRFIQECQAGDVVSKAQDGLRMEGFKLRSREVTSATSYVGAPSSDRRMRVYDKDLESKNKTHHIAAVRWELQQRNEAAESLMAALTTPGRRWQDVITQALVSFVDFRDEASHSEVEKRDRCSWFELLVGAVKRANVYAARDPGTIHDRIAWLKQQIAPTLALVTYFWGGDVSSDYAEMLKEGRRRWKPKHLALLGGDLGR